MSCIEIVRSRLKSFCAAAGFTLIELLVVIAVIGVLVGLLYPSVQRAIIKAKQARCIEQLHQFGVAAFRYKEDNNERFPPWLSTLYPEYIDAKEMYLCSSDYSHGADGSRPNDMPGSVDQFPETDDLPSNSDPAATNRNPNITVCSYMYEFCAAECSWAGDLSSHLVGQPWYAVKTYQMAHGDGFHAGGYNATFFPLIRCFNHWQEGSSEIVDGATSADQDWLTLNVSYLGNVFRAPMQWELRK